MKKKLIISLLVLFASLFFLNFGEVSAKGPTFDLGIKIKHGNNEPTETNIPGLAYGQAISIDTGSWGNEGHEFLGYVIQGKVSQTIEKSQLFRVTEDMDVVLHFKPVNSTAVIFMDSNHDFIDVRYTNASGKLNDTPEFASLSKPGLNATGWSINNILDYTFTEDTIVYLEYENSSSTKTLTFDIGSGVETVTKDYNSLVKLTANGTGNFSYWLKDGKIASLNSEYTFTMVDDHTVEAVYDDTDFVADSDSLVYISEEYELRTGFNTIVGQIHLPANEEVVEWGIISSELPGAITFDTPGVSVYKSSRYNENSKEFMMSFNSSEYTFTNYRGFAKVINTETEEVKTVYSYYQVEGEPVYATDLIISEYGEGSSNNKWIEIYNGTGQTVNLSDYKLELYANGVSSPSNTEPFDGNPTLAHGATYVVAHGSSNETIKGFMDATSSVTNFNGDDVVALKKGTVVIDILGVIGSTTKFGENKTLVRKSGITSPNDTYTEGEWNSYSSDTFIYIKSHTMDLIPGTDIILTIDSTIREIIIDGLTSVNVNETIQLTSDVEDVIWISSNPAVLTVNANGLVTGVAEGSANVTAYNLYDHSVYDSIIIEVLPLQNYDVTFNNEGVTSLVTVDGGSLVEEPISPTKSGYVFEGWFVDLSNEHPYDFNTPVQSDLTLHAKWVEITDILDFRTTQTGKYIEGIVTGINGRYIYINDETAAIAHYDLNYTIVNSISIGDKILFGDVLYDVKNGLAQFGYSSHKILSTNNTLPEALSITSLSEITEELQSQRVSISGLTVSSFDGVNLFVSDGTNTIMIWSMTQTAVRQLIETAVDNQTINLVNIHVGWYINREFTALNVEEIQLIELSDTMKVNEIKTELTDLYSGKSYASGGQIDLIATNSRFGGAITWAASNPVINVFNGSIGTVESDTSVTLTATIDVNGTTDTITLEVVVLSSGASTVTTVTAAYSGGTTNMTDGNNATTIGLNPDIFNVESVKRELNPLHIGLNKLGQIRLYGSSDTNGNILNININSSYHISSVTFNFGDTVGNALIKSDDIVKFNDSLTKSSSLTYSDLNAAQISIKNLGTGQIYILSIEITYINP